MNASESLTLARQGKIQQAEQALTAEMDNLDASVADWPAVIEAVVKATSAPARVKLVCILILSMTLACALTTCRA